MGTSRRSAPSLIEAVFGGLTACADAACGGVAAIRSVVWGVMAGANYQVVTAQREAEEGGTFAQVASELTESGSATFYALTRAARR